jgi:hypothetical protein
MKEIFALISAVLILIAAPPYVIDTIKGKTKPERVTWLIFSVLGLIAFISQLGLGASWSLVFSGLDTTASILVFILAIKYGVGGHTRFDIAALVIASLGVVIAIVAKEPIISLLGVIIADLSGMALTIRKTYISPNSETTISWLLVGTASLFGLLAVGKLSYAILLYPFYLMLANYSVPITQVLSRNIRKTKPRTLNKSN